MPRAKKVAKPEKTTKSAVKPVKGRQRCSIRGCRKLQKEGSEFCDAHSSAIAADTKEAAESAFPIDTVVKCTEVEALRFAKLDTEIRNNLQGIRIAALEKDALSRQLQERMAAYDAHIKQLKAEQAAKAPEYDNLVRELAAKYGVKDPRNMSIDVDTRVVRDLSNK